MIGFIVEETYPSHKHTFTILPGTLHSGQAAKIIFNMKNGAQQNTNVKKTSPRTLVAFCSVATEFADSVCLFLVERNLKKKHKFL